MDWRIHRKITLDIGFQLWYNVKCRGQNTVPQKLRRIGYGKNVNRHKSFNSYFDGYSVVVADYNLLQAGGLIMSRQSRRRKCRKHYHTMDSTAERENGAIKTMSIIGNVQQPQLNRTYSVDGYTFMTGKKHRYGGGVGVTDKRTQPSFLWD